VARTFTPADNGSLTITSSANGTVVAAPDCQSECAPNPVRVIGGQPVTIYLPVEPPTTVTMTLVHDQDAFNDTCETAVPMAAGDNPIDMTGAVVLPGLSSCNDGLQPIATRTFTPTTNGRLTVRGLTTPGGFTSITPTCEPGVPPLCLGPSQRVAANQSVFVILGSLAPDVLLAGHPHGGRRQITWLVWPTSCSTAPSTRPFGSPENRRHRGGGLLGASLASTTSPPEEGRRDDV
jgi:hypothetical protein